LILLQEDKSFMFYLMYSFLRMI
ncbi:uncharacterized protein METZ01_LOCUS415863, partial [marine metagenome]